MRPNPPRPWVATAIIMVVVGGCGGDTPPSEPDPQPRYEQIPEDLCERLEVEDVAERFGLSMAPWYEPGSRYAVLRTYWSEFCSLTMQADNDRFATEIEDFEPSGAVDVRIYHEVADAEEAYDHGVRNYFERPTELTPAATIMEASGWWDSGIQLDKSEELDPEFVVMDEDAEISGLGVRQLIRHENLLLLVHLDALAPTPETAVAFELLHDLVGALIDEAVEHLTLATE